MKKNQKIIFISLIFSSIAFFCTAGGSQESVSPDRPSQNSKQSANQSITIPSGEKLTMLRLQYFAENAESEPALALSGEQVSMILPILKDWQAAVKDDSDTDSTQFVDSIIAELTEEQAAFLPPPPNVDPQSDSSDRQGPPNGQRPPKGQRPNEGQRPPMNAIEVQISIPEMLINLIDIISTTV